jgi:hypothetical protein
MAQFVIDDTDLTGRVEEEFDELEDGLEII